MASRATRPPSSSTAIKRGVPLAACISRIKLVACSGDAIFFPNRTSPPTGYWASVSAMAPDNSVTPAPAGSSIWSSVWDKSNASGRTRNSCPTFSRRVIFCKRSETASVSVGGSGSGWGGSGIVGSASEADVSCWGTELASPGAVWEQPARRDRASRAARLRFIHCFMCGPS